jgi:hypothetical protein
MSLPRPFQFGLQGLLILAVIAGLYAWKSYEVRTASDVLTMSSIMQLKAALERYAGERFAYPPAPQPLILGVSESNCLSRDGFTGASAPACTKGMLHLMGGEEYFIYTPLAADGTSICADARGCPSFAITFELKGSRIFSKGEHRLTPNGIQ